MILHFYSLIFQFNLLTLHLPNHNLRGVLGNDLIVVQHLEFFRGVTAHVRVKCLGATCTKFD